MNMNQVRAVRDLAKRIIPKNHSHFKFEICKPIGGKDGFKLKNAKDGRLLIMGNTGVSLASGLNYYLKNFCNFHLSWCGDNREMPGELPKIKKTIISTTPHTYRPYFNYCTFNYSATWWDWERWEQEIDFMALNGINMPLNIIGTEKVWYDTLLQNDFSDVEARSFLVGPCYLAWQLLTNIQSHAGPLPKTWIIKRARLGEKIFRREQELGMKPIQHGFSGYVPKKLTDKYPEANINQERSWCGFRGTFQLDPLDPLFNQIGKDFFTNLFSLYGGSSHYLAIDPFHEGKPPIKGKNYQRKVGESIFDLIDDVDPLSTWVMQAWSIRKNIVKPIPKNRLLIMDLSGNKWKTKWAFWGRNFVTGILHNFGSRINLHGNLKKLAKNKFTRESGLRISNLIKKKQLGFGLFMEGINQNPVYYDLALDLIWRKKPIDLKSWLKKYIRRRYGKINENLIKVWDVLLKGPYKRGTDGVEYSSQIGARPALNVKKSGPNAKLKIPYDPKTLNNAWKLMIKESKRGDMLNYTSGFRFDLVDLGRQVISNYLQKYYPEIRESFYEKDIQKFRKKTHYYLQALLDVDRLLSTREEYDFHTWLNNAYKHATNPKEKALYDLNARMLFSIWGPMPSSDREPHIFDYAWKEWSGLISDYYYPRWQQFFEFLEKKLEKGEDYHEKGLPKIYGRETFRANQFYEELADWETKWIKQGPPEWEEWEKNRGKEIEISLEIFKKYKKNLEF